MGNADKAPLYEQIEKQENGGIESFFHFLAVTLVNAFMILKSVRDEKIPLKSFKLKLIHGLCGATAFKQTKSRIGQIFQVKKHNGTIHAAIQLDG